MKALRAFSSSSRSFVSLAVVLLSSSVSSASSAVPAPLSQSLGVYSAWGLACLVLESLVVFVDSLAIWSGVMNPPETGEGCGCLLGNSLGTRIMLPPTSIESISVPVPSALAPTWIATLPRAPASSLSMNLSRASPIAFSASFVVFPSLRSETADSDFAPEESHLPFLRRLVGGSVGFCPSLGVFPALTSVPLSEKVMNPSPIFFVCLLRSSTSESSPSKSPSSSSSTAPNGFNGRDERRSDLLLPEALFLFLSDFSFFVALEFSDIEILMAGTGTGTGAGAGADEVFDAAALFLHASRRFRFRSAAVSVEFIVSC
mmetsp:Transcript_7905/g.19631  ORF Transcript_7905/g.19631 Transcript_7905/m.19631 type:complete len:316 (-) Transcript_7905:101-1048(-)